MTIKCDKCYVGGILQGRVRAQGTITQGKTKEALNLEPLWNGNKGIGISLEENTAL